MHILGPNPRRSDSVVLTWARTYASYTTTADDAGVGGFWAKFKEHKLGAKMDGLSFK